MKEGLIRGHSNIGLSLKRIEHLDDVCLERRRDGGALVLRTGCDGTVGGGDGCSLPLQELQDGLNVCSHLRLQSNDRETGR